MKKITIALIAVLFIAAWPALSVTVHTAVTDLANTWPLLQTYTLGIKLSGATSGAVTMLAPATTTPYTLYPPAAAGSASQLLGNSSTPGALAWFTPTYTTAAQIRKTCNLVILGSGTSGALQNTDFGTELDGQDCFVNAPATLLEVTIRADTGTPSVIVHRDRLGTVVDILSSGLATASGGAQACSQATSTTCLDGTTSSTASLQNTSLSAGDWFGVTSGSASTGHRMSIAITYSPN